MNMEVVMAHEIYWLKPDRVLYVSYQGHQTAATLKACLDDMADQLDTVTYPVIILINWLEVVQADSGVLKSNLGHRAYSHPMAARGVLVGFDRQEAFENEVTAVKTRGGKNTQYYKTLDEALDHLRLVLADTND
jgi:hypothetical protein